MKRLALNKNIVRLQTFDKFPFLTTLTLDDCGIGDDDLQFPLLPVLNNLKYAVVIRVLKRQHTNPEHSTSLNKNHISYLEGLLQEVEVKFPSLIHLSLLGNPVSPHPISDAAFNYITRRSSSLRSSTSSAFSTNKSSGSEEHEDIASYKL